MGGALANPDDMMMMMIIGWGRTEWRDSVCHGNTKLTNTFFFIGLDRSRLTNLFRCRSIRFMDYKCNQCRLTLHFFR